MLYLRVGPHAGEALDVEEDGSATRSALSEACCFRASCHILGVGVNSKSSICSRRGPQHAYGLRQVPACVQVLLALYFFLAGCMVSQSRLMWVVPAASASFALLFATVSHASGMLSSTFRCAKLTFWTDASLAQALWHLVDVCMIAAGLMCIWLATLVLIMWSALS